MRIRTITGDTLSAAMAKVREELGGGAIILHVEDAKSRKGVVVRAAAETLDSEMPGQASQSVDERIETQLEQELRERLRTFQPVRGAGPRIDPYAHIAPALEYHRVPDDLAGRLIAISGEASAASPDIALAHALERMVGCGPLPLKPARPLIALGAPGHGKTTALARLAAQSASAGYPVVLVTLDTGKAGAVTQIETYASLLKARVETCTDAAALAQIATELPEKAAVFVDTPGLNPWSAGDLAQARAWIQSCGGEPVWIVSAESSADDMAEAASVYRSLGARRMIATKLDAARRLGGIVAAAAKGPVALAGTIASPFLAHGVETPNHLRLAGRLLETAPAQTAFIDQFSEARSA
jgi:flagellar biosynthesis protein FlhF